MANLEMKPTALEKVSTMHLKASLKTLEIYSRNLEPAQEKYYPKRANYLQLISQLKISLLNEPISCHSS